MLPMSPGEYLRSLHHRLFVAPVTRIVAHEVDEASARLAAVLDEANRDIHRILGDFADANDQVAEAIGRSLTRLAAEVEALQRELPELARGAYEPDTTH
jgi:hypothetical protein